MRHHLRACCTAAALALLSPLAGAQVYKWTDDKGVVNYSNTPPADAKARKNTSVVEDRVSVYSADPAVVQATQNARERRNGPPPPAAAPTPPVAVAPPPPPIAAADPCATYYDPMNCGYYEGVPVYGGGRRRPPHLIQPNLPPGATAGNVNAGTGYTPGLSTQSGLGAQPPVVQRQVPQTARGRDLPTR